MNTVTLIHAAAKTARAQLELVRDLRPEAFPEGIVVHVACPAFYGLGLAWTHPEEAPGKLGVLLENGAVHYYRVEDVMPAIIPADKVPKWMARAWLKEKTPEVTMKTTKVTTETNGRKDGFNHNLADLAGQIMAGLVQETFGATMKSEREWDPELARLARLAKKAAAALLEEVAGAVPHKESKP
jgi:hypothetical protein